MLEIDDFGVALIIWGRAHSDGWIIKVYFQ